MTRAVSSLVALVMTAAVACVGDPEVGEDKSAVVDGTADAVGLLRFLNDPATTLEVLDDQVPLDRRAAENLIAARPFATVVEVDAVKYVGEAALSRLIDHARAHGFVPAGSDVLGSYDGVPFTVDQAAAALRLVNEESDGVLTGEVGLDSRAVRSIVAARPVRSMPELADLYYVGTRGLERLRDHVSRWIPAPGERLDCRGDFQCGDGERCGGIPSDGSTEYGKCYPVATHPDYWRDCADAAPCPDSLFCSGLTLGDGGWCAPAWMQDTFHNQTQRFISTDGAVVATAVVVYGQATVPMDIVVDLDLRHDRPHDLWIALYDPNGAEAVLWNGPSEGGRAFPTSFVALGSISRDDQVNGRWLLRVRNVGGRGLGNLHSWQMWISSRFD